MSGILYWAHAAATPFSKTSVENLLHGRRKRQLTGATGSVRVTYSESSTSTARTLVCLTASWIVSAHTSDSEMPPILPV